MAASAQICLLSTSDTDLLSARASGASFSLANPARATGDELRSMIDGADLVVVRHLGSPHDLWDGLGDVRAAGTPLVILGGEQQPSAELMELSTVPIGVAAETHRYLSEGDRTT
ncbi:hypothetical protein [Nocardioides alcanivorans]|uniref:hypothetical protein n=1 Tax=Nocardioides alcanivorans TaxID=2897352 RepID=UPI001F1C1579|nr:hypothetical protein [Nocardioides alcanivorans]